MQDNRKLLAPPQTQPQYANLGEIKKTSKPLVQFSLRRIYIHLSKYTYIYTYTYIYVCVDI